MTFKFYVQLEGQVYGPYSVRELMNLGLLDDTLITEESMNGEWLLASSFNFVDLLQQEDSAVDGPSVQVPSRSKAWLKWVVGIAACLILIGGAAVIYDNSRSSSYIYRPEPTPSPTPTPAPSPTPNPEPAPSPEPTQMVMCPMCNGTGTFSYMPGDVFAPQQPCTGCNATGRVDPQKAVELIKMAEEIRKMINPTPTPNPTPQRDNTICINCNGSGKCSSCAGRGEKRYEGMYGQPGGIMDCPTCKGTGRCDVCHGSGHIY